MMLTCYLFSKKKKKKKDNATCESLVQPVQNFKISQIPRLGKILITNSMVTTYMYLLHGLY